MEDKICVQWSNEDECYIATANGTDLIGCGDTENEAIFHLKNHLLDERDTPRKRHGKLATKGNERR